MIHTTLRNGASRRIVTGFCSQIAGALRHNWNMIFLPAAKQYSHLEAREELEHGLLRPLSSNLLSEVIQALRNQTLLCQYSTKDVNQGQEDTGT